MKSKGLVFHLSEGVEKSESGHKTSRVAPTEPLSRAETDRILARLPDLKREASDTQDFALRAGSPPPPRTGATVRAVFPSTEDRRPPETSDSKRLEVIRYSPTGEVEAAPQLSLTFSRAVIAITSQEEAARQAPVTLTPQTAGRWRWLGTRTLIFDPEGGRLPMATEFRAVVPAGTRAADGTATTAALSWTFATPPPSVETRWPEANVVRPDALIFVGFDQRIEPAAVLRAVRVRAGTREIPVRLATNEEIKADESVGRLTEKAVAGRYLVFRAGNAANGEAGLFPSDSQITVTIGPGTPSAEGPRLTKKAEAFTFRTYGPLRVVASECGYDKRCVPGAPWRIRFSNPLDAESFDVGKLKIEPELKGVSAQIYGDTLHVTAPARGRTTYIVTLDGSIKDTFGQTLGSEPKITFNVGAAPPVVASAGGTLVVLDPSARPEYPVYTINHNNVRVSLYRVQPEQWELYLAYLRYRNGFYDDGRKNRTVPAMPGTRVYSQVVAVGDTPEEMKETRVDLAPALRDGRGHAVVLVESMQPRTERGMRDWVSAWVQATGIGLDAFVDQDELTAFVSSLADGRPLAGAEVTLLPSGERGASGTNGLMRMPLPANPGNNMGLLVARVGQDAAFLPERSNFWGTGTDWIRREARDTLRWFVFDDRRIYRPGEEVSVKGWIRRVGLGPAGDVNALGGAARAVTFTVQDSRGNRIGEGRADVNALGGFHTSFKLPATPNLGGAHIQLNAEGEGITLGRQHHHSFQVQEFRRPEFEVTAQASEGPHLVGGHALATVAATYYAGGGLADSEVNWHVRARPTNYTPPNRGDYTFGKWVPWWEAQGYEGETGTQTFNGRTDATGKHNLRIDFDSVDPPRPSSVTAEAGVVDVNRQAWTAMTTMLVHPSELYVGLRSARTFVQQGQPLVVESIVTDIDGRIIADRDILMRAALLEWKYGNGEWRQVEGEPEECRVRSAGQAVKCVFRPTTGGAYRVTARVHDDRERANESELTLWVAGGKRPVARNVAQEKVELIPDRKEYAAGDTAELLVQSPFYPAEGLLTLRRSGLIRTERFRMEGPTHTLRIPIEEGYTPNVHAQVDLTGASARADEEGNAIEGVPKRPAYATGSLNLSVPPLTRKLLVEAVPRERALEPGGETIVAVEVKDAAGRAVGGSELAVVVVDESILALTGYKLLDPLSVFYMQRGADVRDLRSRANVMLEQPEQLISRQVEELPVSGRRARALDSLGGGTVGAQSASPPPPPASAPARAKNEFALERADDLTVGFVDNATVADGTIHLRENFNALAVFAPSVVTDGAGRAEVKVKLPDSLTRYRVMALSVAGGKQFGAGESSITARRPLMVRPSAPRFLNFGDRAEVPVVLQNQTDAPLEVGVAIRAVGVELPEGDGRRVRVPANDRVEVRFPVAATQAGTARFQFGASAGRHTDAAQIELPVWTPATTEAFATYGEIDDGAAVIQPVAAPPGVFTQFGGLEVTTSSTQLQALTDAVLYLVSYPYECTEQLSSRIIAVAALKDVLAAFKTKEMPAPEELRAAVSRDIKRLGQLQNDDGGFGFWRRGEESWPYVSIHVANALARAEEKGFDVPKDVLDKSRAYLRDIERRIPRRYSRESRAALTAYALNVRMRLGERDSARARRLITTEGLENLSLEAVGWLLPVLSGDAASAAEVAAIRRLLNNRVAETAGTAHFVTDYGDDGYLLLHSSRRADGIILEALINDRPADDLIPKIVRGLLAHRKAGRWENTQENAFVLLALDRYFRTYEKTTPDFVARAWLGQAYAGEQQFRGRSTDYRQFNVPMSALAESAGAQNLALTKEGAGRLYYRIGLRYAPSSLKLAAADYGFTVERVYEGVDDPSDVRREADGTWQIKAGAQVRVRLTMGAPARRYHVALTDPLPAGLEPLNPELAVTGIAAREEMNTAQTRGMWWLRRWFEHQNMRDERVEAFASLLYDGVYEYSYLARATTPGTFVVPPAKAEEMYHPETFGRGATDRVVIR